MNRVDVIRDLQERSREFGRSLNERERRQWAAAEAMKLGRGGITIVSHALRMSPNTIKRGIQELSAGSGDSNVRIRQAGGGRRSKALSRDAQARLGSGSAGADPSVGDAS